MLGPEILVTTMSVATIKGKATQEWQYHSRSDRHSKVACWTVLFDLLFECDVFRRHANEGKLSFGVNRVIPGKIPKTLDLVICRVPARRSESGRRTLLDLAKDYGIVVDAVHAQELAAVPLFEDRAAADASEVLVALEAKACMTEHVKSIPRLFAELLATGYLAKRASVPVTGCHVIVNAANTFVTPSSGAINRHQQPHDVATIVDMIGSAVPTTHEFQFGYDAIGVTVVDCDNAGSPVGLVTAGAAPTKMQHHHYDNMIHSLCSSYRQKIGPTM